MTSDKDSISDFILDVESNRITNLADPVDEQDATTKYNVDAVEIKLEKLQWVVEDPDNRTVIKDIDGNWYKTLLIDTIVWMIENLKTTRYNDGTDIPLVTNQTEWSSLTSPGYCWYNNNEVNYKEPYGALYNWYVADTNIICPVGWHIPSLTEYNSLIEYFGGTELAGGKLKEAGTKHWASPNEGATNESGFTGLPGGYRSSSFDNIRLRGYIWSSTSQSSSLAYYLYLYFITDNAYVNWFSKMIGCSIRCIKD